MGFDQYDHTARSTLDEIATHPVKAVGERAVAPPPAAASAVSGGLDPELLVLNGDAFRIGQRQEQSLGLLNRMEVPGGVEGGSQGHRLNERVDILVALIRIEDGVRVVDRDSLIDLPEERSQLPQLALDRFRVAFRQPVDQVGDLPPHVLEVSFHQDPDQVSAITIEYVFEGAYRLIRIPDAGLELGSLEQRLDIGRIQVERLIETGDRLPAIGGVVFRKIGRASCRKECRSWRAPQR